MSLVPPAVALRAYYFFAFAAMGLYLPFFPTWLRSRGFISWQMSALLALLPICQLVSPSLVGMLADKLALRARVITFCAICTALGISTFALAAARFDPLPFVFALLCMFAFALLRAPLIGLAEVIAIETAPNYGRMRLWGSLGFMVSALVGGKLIDPTSAYQLPASVAGVIWGLVLISRVLPKGSRLAPRPALEDARALLLQPTFRHLLVTMVFVFGGMSGYDLCATLRLRELNASGTYVGTFWSIATAAEVVLLYWAKPVLQWLGPGRLLTIACAISAGRWLFLSQATSLSLILMLQPLHALSFALMWVSSMGVLARELGTKGTATAQGLYASAVAVGATLGIAAWGTVYDTWGSENVFLGASCASALAALSASRLIRPRKMSGLTVEQ